MLRNKIAFALLAIATVAFTACSNPTAPKKADCGSPLGGQICK